MHVCVRAEHTQSHTHSPTKQYFPVFTALTLLLCYKPTAATRAFTETPATPLCVNQVVLHTAAASSRTCAVVTMATEDRPVHSYHAQPETAVQVTTL